MDYLTKLTCSVSSLAIILLANTWYLLLKSLYISLNYINFPIYRPIVPSDTKEGGTPCSSSKVPSSFNSLSHSSVTNNNFLIQLTLVKETAKKISFSLSFPTSILKSIIYVVLDLYNFLKGG